MPLMRHNFSILGFIVLFNTASAWAGDIVSVRDLPDKLERSRQGQLTPSDTTLLGVTIGQVTLDGIRSRFGAAKTFREPPHGTSANEEICYSSDNPGDTTQVIFGAGPMGGWSHVTQFQVVSRVSQAISCAPSAKVSSAISTNSGIRLGMSLKELSQRFGRPTGQGASYVIYSFKRDRGKYEVISGIEASIVDDRVTSFCVFLIKSN